MYCMGVFELLLSGNLLENTILERVEKAAIEKGGAILYGVAPGLGGPARGRVTKRMRGENGDVGVKSYANARRYMPRPMMDRRRCKGGRGSGRGGSKAGKVLVSQK